MKELDICPMIINFYFKKLVIVPPFSYLYKSHQVISKSSVSLFFLIIWYTYKIMRENTRELSIETIFRAASPFYIPIKIQSKNNSVLLAIA